MGQGLDQDLGALGRLGAEGASGHPKSVATFGSHPGDPQQQVHPVPALLAVERLGQAVLDMAFQRLQPGLLGLGGQHQDRQARQARQRAQADDPVLDLRLAQALLT